MMPTALAMATPSSPNPPESPPSIGTTSTMATMARSWKIRNPNVTLPDGDAVVPLSARSFSTIAVELRATRKPVNSDVFQSTPNARHRPMVIAVVIPTWSEPPPRINNASWRSRARLNSMPIVKSSRITPRSAAWLMRSRSSTSPSPFGPIRMPESRKPTMGIRPMRWEM